MITRILVLAGALALVLAAFGGPRAAHAQADPHAGHAHAADPHAGHAHAREDARAPAPPAPDGAAGTHAGHDHDTPGAGVLRSDKKTALLFWLFALGCIVGSVFVITRRNLIAAVMGMVGTFFAVAAVYLMLFASFLAVIQLLVYAGAIMVLFVFVIMVLNRPEQEPWGLTGIPGKALAGVAMLYMLVRLGQVLWSVAPATAAQAAAPAPYKVALFDREVGQLVTRDIDFGSTRAVGYELFNNYLFPFEAVSVVLLVAVVGAVMIARPFEKAELPPAESAEGEA